ncbi:MAG TPA: glycosyltransferase family 39 protein [Thermoanaerobaculia bacterium]|nr:glycosyltransferase family 39 protein [Thermoanaerobaculia bacterium]
MQTTLTPGRHGWWRSQILLAVAIALGIGLRLLFVFRFPAVTPDGRLYRSIAETWARFGVYGTDPGSPSALRMPGYPAFLAGIHLLFGSIRPTTVFLVQTVVDLATCVVVGMLAATLFDKRVGRTAFVLALLCPFTANYVSLLLTESLAIFTTALALLLAFRARARLGEKFPLGELVGAGAATGLGILIRPDGAVLLPVLAFALSTPGRGVGWKRTFGAVAIVSAVALGFLAPWAARNALTLDRFQVLQPGVIVGKGERVAVGFNRWLSTWILDYVSDQEVWWKTFSHEPIDPAALPPRAFGSPGDPKRTLALIAEFNRTATVSESLDRKFDDLAAERIRARPWSYYAIIPLGRMADMWLRPRTQMLPLESRWWEFRNERQSWISIGYAGINLVYLALALSGALRHLRRPEVWILVGFAVLRTAAIATVGNPCSPEERYTLECYPAVLVLAAAGLVRFRAS